MRHIPEVEGPRGRRRPASYYGVPPTHEPHWRWLIISYFFLGGLSGASYVVATVAELFGDRDDRDTVRVGRYVALLALIPCPILLILGLGRPERFYTMLRVMKLRSPMSLRTRGLLAFGGCASLSAGVQAVRDGLLGGAGGMSWLLRRVPSRLVGVVGSGFALFVGGYTGVLLGATAVPLWAKNARLLGPLFLSSALAAACAAISLVLACLPGRRERALERLHRAETVAAMGELAASVAVHLHSGRLGEPLTTDRIGWLYRICSLGLGVGVPIGLHGVGPRIGLPYRLITIVSSVGSLVGSFVVKYAVVMAGHLSVDDPAATFECAEGQAPGRRESADELGARR